MTPGRVTVGYLHPGELSAVFADSLFDLLLNDLAGPCRTAHTCGKLAKECGSAGIVDGRNALAKAMCDDSDAEWLWMVDSDMGFAHDTLERLTDVADPKSRPVVGALCFAHKADGRSSFGGVKYRAQPTLYRWVETDDKVGVTPMFDYERDALVECVGTGGACILIHRSVLERMRDKFGPVWFDPITHPKGPTTFSEDLSFCLRVAMLDIPLFVHTGIKTTHDKGGVFLDEEFYDAQQRARAS